MAIPPIPRQSIVLRLQSLISLDWDNWFQALVRAITAAPSQVASTDVTGQHATIGSTAFMLPSGTTLDAGLYRVTYAAQVTRAASSSSSLQVAVGWHSGGVAQTVTGAALTANTTTTRESVTLPMLVDAATVPTYTVTYASSGVTSMQFWFAASLEALP